MRAQMKIKDGMMIDSMKVMMSDAEGWNQEWYDGCQVREWGST